MAEECRMGGGCFRKCRIERSFSHYHVWLENEQVLSCFSRQKLWSITFSHSAEFCDHSLLVGFRGIKWLWLQRLWSGYWIPMVDILPMYSPHPSLLQTRSKCCNCITKWFLLKVVRNSVRFYDNRKWLLRSERLWCKVEVV